MAGGAGGKPFDDSGRNRSEFIFAANPPPDKDTLLDALYLLRGGIPEEHRRWAVGVLSSSRDPIPPSKHKGNKSTTPSSSWLETVLDLTLITKDKKVPVALYLIKYGNVDFVKRALEKCIRDGKPDKEEVFRRLDQNSYLSEGEKAKIKADAEAEAAALAAAETAAAAKAAETAAIKLAAAAAAQAETAATKLARLEEAEKEKQRKAALQREEAAKAAAKAAAEAAEKAKHATPKQKARNFITALAGTDKIHVLEEIRAFIANEEHAKAFAAEGVAGLFLHLKAADPAVSKAILAIMFQLSSMSIENLKAFHDLRGLQIALSECLTSADRDVYLNAMKLIGNLMVFAENRTDFMNNRLLSKLTPYLQHDDPEIQAQALSVLAGMLVEPVPKGIVGNDEAIKVILFKCLAEPKSTEVLCSVLMVINNLNSGASAQANTNRAFFREQPGIFQALRKAMGHADKNVRDQALYVLNALTWGADMHIKERFASDAEIRAGMAICLRNGERACEDILRIILDVVLHCPEEVKAIFKEDNELMEAINKLNTDPLARQIIATLNPGHGAVGTTVGVAISGVAPETISLFDAAAKGDVKLVKSLLEEGASVDSVNSKGQTPLFAAAEFGHLKVVQALLAAGATVNPLDADSFTPFMLAAWNHRIEVVKTLLAAGVPFNKITSSGRSLLDFILQGNLHEVAGILREAGALTGAELRSAAAAADARVVAAPAIINNEASTTEALPPSPVLPEAPPAANPAEEATVRGRTSNPFLDFIRSWCGCGVGPDTESAARPAAR